VTPAVIVGSREARRARGQHSRRTKLRDENKAAAAQRMHASGESASTIANTGVSRASVYGVLAKFQPTPRAEYPLVE
jgi:hypothetical protein